MQYDLIIIGGGPAAVAAGVYAARKRLKALVIAEVFGGQSIVSPDIQNWIGTKNISGQELANQLREHLLVYNNGDFIVKEGVRVDQVERAEGGFKVITSDGNSFDTKTVLVATGAHRRRLEVPGAEKYDQKGITYCATCDAPMFADKDVAVIGGGNAAFETVVQLTAYAKSITLLHRGDNFKADQITIEKVRQQPKVTIIPNAEVQEFKGGTFVQTLVYKDKVSGEIKEIPAEGVFVEIGFLPSTDFVKNLVEVNEHNAIKIDSRTQRTSLPGVWAAGDCTDALYHQNNIAAGDAIKALEDIYNYLHLQS